MSEVKTCGKGTREKAQVKHLPVDVYTGISQADYTVEKRRLQIELLKIQQRLVEEGRRIVCCFEGRDAAGKGSVIQRFIENLMPLHARKVIFGIPTAKESKYWLRRYERQLPKPGEMVFFDRSWYTRALIEPTMGYCTEAQYNYFMRRVLDWEHDLIDQGIAIVKFYLSVDNGTQLIRFGERQVDPLKFWKLSSNDINARQKWQVFTRYKIQMFERTSSSKSPWVVINANSKRAARLSAMLYFVRLFGREPFQPLTGELVNSSYAIEIDGVSFNGLSAREFMVLRSVVERAKIADSQKKEGRQ